MGVLGPRVLDVGLSALDAECDKIYVCSAEPTTYGQATTAGTYALGSKSFTQGTVFGAPGAGSPDGRSTVSVAITDGSITNSGTISHWAAVDSTASRLLARGAVTGGIAVTGGQSFTLGAITVNLSSSATSGAGAEALAFLARAGAMDATHENAYIALINTLVADGAWSSIDALHIYATDTSAHALLNLKDSRFTGEIAGTPTFTADEGFTFTVSDVIYVGPSVGGTDTFDPVTITGVNYSQNAAALGIWMVTEPGLNLGIAWDSSVLNIYPNYSSQCFFRINDDTPSTGLAVSDGLGLSLGTRINSTTINGYRNGASIGTNTTTSVMPTGTTGAIKTGNNTGQVACIVIGGNLNAVQGAIYSALRTYMTTMGVP